MKLVMTSDASFDHLTRAAGWGAWAVVDTEPGTSYGGRFVNKPQTSAEAEIAAIANALHRFGEDRGLSQVSSVLMQSDCTRALQVIFANVPGVSIVEHVPGPMLHYGAKNVSELEQAALDWIVRLVGRKTLSIEHIGVAKSWGSKQCARIAREEMLRVRREQAHDHA